MPIDYDKVKRHEIEATVAAMTPDDLRELARRMAAKPGVTEVELTFHGEEGKLDQVEVFQDTFDYEQLDPGIRDTVRFLRENGFETVDSGDGRSKHHDPRWKVDGKVPEEVLDFPHVAIRVDAARLASEADRLAGLLAGVGVDLVPFGRGGAAVQASYDPADRTAVILVTDFELVRHVP